MMTFINFDANVHADHLVGFNVPANVPGISASFMITITAPGTPGAPGPLYSIVSFGAPLPANRHIVFTAPPTVPIGMAHFFVLITSGAQAKAIYQIAPQPTKKKSKKKPGSTGRKRDR